MFKKILIANRGEIALRVMRACREMGIRTVGVYSEADRRALHVRYADEAVAIGPAPSRESYLRIDRVVDAARATGADAIHPGYGFLSENPTFARAVADAGLTFIGPPPEAMELLGSKTSARELAMNADLPVLPGANQNLDGFDAIWRAAQRIGFPVMIKAAAGGGGKGMRMVRAGKELEGAWRNSRSEALNAFGDPSLYLEKFIERPRHVEVQVLGDRYGNLVHLGERECSMQRRHQKVMEEAPSPRLTPDLRAELGETALRMAKLGGYYNAGTVEFLMDADDKFYFLEVNARLQVEHPVTELVTGIDLVKEQIRVAAGEPLGFRQEDISLRGAAIECRIAAEDPARDFFPSPGLITTLRTPSGPGVRDDSGVYEGWRVPIEYDPLMAKLIVWGHDRAEAMARMERALGEYEVGGIETGIPFFQRALRHPEFRAGRLDTELVARILAEAKSEDSSAGPDSAASGSGDRSDRELAAMVATSLAISAAGAPPVSGAKTTSGNHAWRATGRDASLNRWSRG